jgi:hypothetical protein
MVNKNCFGGIMPFNVSEFAGANDQSDNNRQSCEESSTPEGTGQKDQYYFTFFKDLPSDDKSNK